MNYVARVADHFLSHCPHISILTPDDFVMIAEWQKREIPIDVILGTIDEACRELSHESEKIGSMTDMRGRVRANYIKWLQSDSG